MEARESTNCSAGDDKRAVFVSFSLQEMRVSLFVSQSIDGIRMIFGADNFWARTYYTKLFVAETVCYKY